MKKRLIYTWIALFTLIPFIGFSNQWNDYNKWFSYQKDIEENVGNYSHKQASIAFNGDVFNFFVYYNSTWQSVDKCEIVVRRIKNKPNSDHPVIHWKLDFDTDKYSILVDKIHDVNMQPSPVIFDGTLYLFYQTDDGLGYVTYNEDTEDWSKPVTNADGPLNFDLGYSSAVQIGDRLCLISNGSGGSQLQINWTTDPTNPNGWSSKIFTATVNYDEEFEYTAISLITKSYLKDSKLAQKLQLAYITPGKNARFAEYEFNDSGQPEQLQNVEIESDLDYSSVALAQGSVNKDSESIGNCTQMFLKKNDKDNGYCRYRIIRWQLIEGGTWTRQEKNLLPQNSPSHMWADDYTNLTALNYALLDDDPSNETGNINQYIVLVYRGYDDWDHPLNMAWAKSDYVTFKNSNVSQDLSNDKTQWQYIGYIEGPPPFYKNTPSSGHYSNDSLVSYVGGWISSLEYSNATVTENETSLAFETSHKLTGKFGHFKPEVSYAHGSKDVNKTEQTKTQSIEIGAADMEGFYIYQAPLIRATEYSVKDRKDGTYLYPTYCFSMQTMFYSEAVELENGLDPSHPLTYMDRDIDYSMYKGFQSNNIGWSGGHLTAGVGTGSSGSETVTTKKSLELGIEFGHILETESERTVEYEVTTKTVSQNEITAVCDMNPAKDGTKEVKQLHYTIHWLRYTPGEPNWWIKDQELYGDQNTWCITYEVTYVKLADNTEYFPSGKYSFSLPWIEDTDTIGQINAGTISKNETQNPLNGTFLGQNFPNPFKGYTRIPYTIGSENADGCLTRLAVFNLNGKEVETIMQAHKMPGNYEIEWDAANIKPGIYYIVMEAGNFRGVNKVIVLK